VPVPYSEHGVLIGRYGMRSRACVQGSGRPSAVDWEAPARARAALGGEQAVASFCAAVLTGISLGNVCS
jgi:hypothetical protein